jgi:magnesium transporter
MLNIYRIAGERLEAVDNDTLVPESADAFWLDLISPGPDDRARIERARDVRLPKMADLEQIKATSRFFVDELGIHLRFWFLERMCRIFVRLQEATTGA